MTNDIRENVTENIKRLLRTKFGLLSDIAILGDGAGRIYVANKPGYVWVRQEQTISETGSPIFTPPFPVRHHPNAIYKVADGTRVQLFIDRNGQLAIESADFDSVVATGGNPAIYNPINPYNKFVNPDQLTPLKSYAVATSNLPVLKVAVKEFAYITDGNVYNFYAGGQYDFASDVPATTDKKVLALLYLQGGVISSATGTEKDALIGWSADDVSEAIALTPSDAVPIALWELTEGMTTIGEKQLFLDIRQWLTVPSATIDTFPTTITNTITIPANRQVVVGKTTIGAGGKLVIHGRVRVV